MLLSSVRKLGCLLLACLFALTVVSCSGDGDDSKPKKGRKKSQETEEGEDGEAEEADGDLGVQAQDLLDQVKSKLPKDEAVKFAEQLEKATTALEADAKKGERLLKSLVAKLKATSAEQKKAVDALKKAEPARKAADEAKKKADVARAAQNAADEYKLAAEAYKKATEAAKVYTVASATAATEHFNAAKEHFEQAAGSAGENAKVKAQAEAEKANMLAMKEKAKAKGAEEKALDAWNRAGTMEREAETFLTSGDFHSAKANFTQAAALYVDALGLVSSEEEQAAAAAAALAQAQSAPAPGTGTPPEGGEEVPPPPPVAPGPSPAGGPGIAVAPPPTSLSLPEGFDPQQYPQELDAEDEEFLLENYRKLSNAGVIEYDPATGMVQLDYQEGRACQKDLDVTRVPKKEYITYKPPDMTNDRNLDPADRKKYAPFSFQGNTQGVVSFPVPFRYYVRVEWYMQILTMDNNATFNVYTMYNPKRSTGYMTNWVGVGTTKGAPPPRNTPPTFLRPANEWFNKQKQIPMVVEYRMPDPAKAEAGPLKSGLLTNIYNNDDSEAEGDGRYTTKLSSAQYTRGLVGFGWSRAKFSVVELKISGILDKEAAVEILRAKLKKPRPKAPKEKVAKEDKKKPAPEGEAPPAGGDNPTAPAGENQ
jgi:chemotaxis protein histidine kinase CheA